MPEQITIETISKEIADVSKSLGEAILKRDEEIKANGQASVKTGEKVDQIGEQLTQISEDAKGLLEQSDEMKRRIDELEKKAGRPGMPDFQKEATKSPGDTFATSDAYASMVKSGKPSCDVVKIKSFFGRKDDYGVVTLDGDANVGSLVVPYRVPEIIIPPSRQFKIRDLLTVAQTSVGAIEYTEETGFAPLYTQLSEDVSAGVKTFPVESVSGCFVGQIVYVNTQEFTVGSIDEANETFTVAGAYGLTEDADSGDPVVSNVFAPTAEARRKPQMNISYELKSLSTKTIATWIPVSRQSLADSGQLSSLIDNRLTYSLGLSEEYQLLYGSGTGQELQGILTNPAVQTYNWSQGEVGDTRIDAVRRAATLSRLAEYPNDGVVLHPTDWEYIELAKGTDARYIWVQVTEGGMMRLWKMPVIDTTAIAAGEFMLGAFKLGATLYDQEQATVDVAEQHADFFIKNMVAVRAEERIALATFRPEAFVKGGFDNAPTS